MELCLQNALASSIFLVSFPSRTAHIFHPFHYGGICISKAKVAFTMLESPYQHFNGIFIKNVRIVNLVELCLQNALVSYYNFFCFPSGGVGTFHPFRYVGIYISKAKVVFAILKSSCQHFH